MFGVYPENDTIHFNGLPSEHGYSYTQKLNGDNFKLNQDKGKITGYLNEHEIFSSTAGIKVTTDRKGNILSIAGIDMIARNVNFVTGGKSYQAKIEPNGLYRIKKGKILLVKKVPFDYPFRKVVR
jgi:hypothetical protein